MLAPVLAVALFAGPATGANQDADEKPSLSLRAAPPVGFSPLRVRLSVDVRGGPDDFEDFYCPTVEWDFGDDSSSVTSADCAPYEAGRSTILRRHTTEHTFRYFGQNSVRVRFSLKQRDRVVASTSTNIMLRQGVQDGFD
jgi:hypothetical protein